MVKPARTLVLFALVAICLGAFVMLVPSGNLQIADGFNIRFVPQKDILDPKVIQYADINAINSSEKLKKDSLLSIGLSSSKDILKSDSLTLSQKLDMMVKGADAKEIRGIKYKIEYPVGQEHLMDNFFKGLDALTVNKGFIRIIHYGDSQLEGDRISGTLRSHLQAQFGGCGAGTIPIFDASDNRSSVKVKYSDNWKKVAVYGGLYKGVKTKNYGVQGTIFKFGSVKDTSGRAVSGGAWITLNKNREGYANTREFSQLKLYYATGAGQTIVKVMKGGTLLSTDTLTKNSGFATKMWQVDSFNSEIKIVFSGASPDVYGLGLECGHGVQVDNVSMRGSSGTDINRLNLQYFANQIKAMDTKLILYEYGLNVVPGRLDNYDFYGRSLYKVIHNLKLLLPDVTIVVLGTSDMSTIENGDYVTFPGLTKVRDAEKKAAFDAGCPYWDMYEAMGGNNSMPSWVNAKPSLAEKDFTHFNPRGAKLIGEMLYNAIMHEYLNYRGNGGK